MRIWSTGCEKPDFLVTHGSELAYALLTCVRIVTLRLPGWNLEHIERELGFSQIMDAVIAHFMRLAEIRREGPFTAALLQHRQQQKSSGGAASNNESLESQGDVRQTPGDTPTLDNGPQADEEEDTVVGVIRLCVSMRSRIRVEMARAQAECKAEGQSMANLDQVPQYQQQPQDAAAMTGLTPAPDTLLAGITGNEAMMNAGADPILQAYEYMSDAVWSGTGTMDDFLMY